MRGHMTAKMDILMTPRNRLLAAIRGEKTDRVPLDLPEYYKVRTREDIDNLEEPAQRELAARTFDYCASLVYFDACISRDFVTPGQFITVSDRRETPDKITVTREFDTPKGKLTKIVEENPITRTGWTKKYAVESLEDVEKIHSIKWVLPDELQRPDPSGLPVDCGYKCIPYTRISSPFVCVAGMTSYEQFLIWCATEPNLIKELTIECKQRVMSILDFMLADKPLEYVWMGGCEWLTPPMGTPRMYAELVQPYEKELIERIHESGAISHIHCHGNVRSTLEMIIARGGDYTEPVEPPPDGDITFAEAKVLAAGRITLGGNIEARILENESADAVEQAVRQAFEGGKKRMVLATTSQPLDRMNQRTIENYHRMIDVYEELSPIDDAE